MKFKRLTKELFDMGQFFDQKSMNRKQQKIAVEKQSWY
jgi:hypothetical protein